MDELKPFFRVGGTLPIESQSYVPRQADTEIVKALLAGEYVYVLDSRQKGKSSLIVRSLAILSEQGITTVRIDLQRLGANLTAEQWFAGILHTIGQELALTSKLFDYWKSHLEIGPMARWMGAIEHVLLAEVQAPIVLFIDEVDYVQTLPFSSDEFFAGIRECFNRRANEPVFRRLSFCLVGVAEPGQLIQNEDVTPFNIGRRVVLTDFTRQELSPYEMALSTHGRWGARLVDRIFYWVSGHPYLTQLLASRIERDPSIRNSADVDRFVLSTIRDTDARSREPNLADLERRLVEVHYAGQTASESRSRVLDAYRQILGQPSPTSRFDSLVVSTLLLSGVVLCEKGKLSVRNRLYRAMFDHRWVSNNLPDLEARRLRTATLRGVVKTAFAGLALLGVLCGFLFSLVSVLRERDRAITETRRLNRSMERAAYEASIALAWSGIESGNYLKASSLIQSQSNAAGRNWEYAFASGLFADAVERDRLTTGNKDEHPVAWAWREQEGLVEVFGSEVRLNRKPFLSFRDPAMRNSLGEWLSATRWSGHLKDRASRSIRSLNERNRAGMFLSYDGRYLVYSTKDKSGFNLLDCATNHDEHIDTGFVPWSIAMSHRGDVVALVSGDRNAWLYDLKRRKVRWHMYVNGFGVYQFSPDDRYLLVPRMSSSASIVRTVDGSLASQLVGHTSPVNGDDWLPDSKSVVTASSDGTVRIWMAETGKLLRTLYHDHSLMKVAVAVNQRSVVAVDQQGSILEWSLEAPPLIQVIHINQGSILQMRLAPDGNSCLTSSMDGVARLVQVRSRKVIGSYDLGVPNRAHPMAFSPDSHLCALGSVSGELVVADTQSGSVLRRVSLSGKHAFDLAFGPSNQLAVSLREGGLLYFDRIENAATFLPAGGYVAQRILFTPDGDALILGCRTGQIGLIEIRSRHLDFLPFHAGQAITSLEISPQRTMIAASSNDSNVYLVDMTSKRLVRKLVGHWSRVWGAHFSKSGDLLATNSADGTSRIWNVSTGKCISVLQHGSWVSSISWLPNGQRVVTACADEFVRVLDPSDGFELLRMSGHGESAFDAAFTPDGTTLISVGGDGKIRFMTVRGARLSHSQT